MPILGVIGIFEGLGSKMISPINDREVIWASFAYNGINLIELARIFTLGHMRYYVIVLNVYTTCSGFRDLILCDYRSNVSELCS